MVIGKAKKIGNGQYEYRGFTLFNCLPIGWEGVNKNKDNWVIHDETKKGVMIFIDIELEELEAETKEAFAQLTMDKIELYANILGVDTDSDMYCRIISELNSGHFKNFDQFKIRLMEELEGDWQLPVLERHGSMSTNEAYIKHNAKYHYFVGETPLKKSLCGRHEQYTREFDSLRIERVNEDVACKQCLHKWKQLTSLE